jgi:hypothetical protein
MKKKLEERKNSLHGTRNDKDHIRNQRYFVAFLTKIPASFVANRLNKITGKQINEFARKLLADMEPEFATDFADWSTIYLESLGKTRISIPARFESNKPVIEA